MDLKEMGWDYVEWVLLAEDMEQWRALLNTVVNLLVP
jgi:hypothetical protein